MMANTRPEEPSGDYSYDLAHEPGVMAEEQVGDHAVPVDRGGPPPRKELEGDYGYDEAHDG
jgi:hypothetical protein